MSFRDPPLPPPPHKAVPLAELRPGASAVVERIDDFAGIGRRLLDLGFVPDTPVRVLRRAPLGDPVSYELRGMKICLRRSEAQRIFVRPAPPAPFDAPRPGTVPHGDLG